MVLNTLTISAAVTPTVIQTLTAHYIHRKDRRQKPTAHISYDEGLNLVRKVLVYSSSRTVEELQAFTAQSVPVPRWVKVEGIDIPETIIESSADTIVAQSGHRGVDKIGGREWWKWRLDGATLKAEWIEMKSDYKARKRDGGKSQRVIFYVHGGAYYFGSVDEHRYQLQRHARKLKARVFAPRYRLAPQFPFPCGLLDCLAAYRYLLTVQDPSTIIMAGDSAGGGMVLSILVILRDQGIPLPSGAILISPWVDLTHSFPSVAGDNTLDYIPAHGFIHRPSPSWPPPNEDDKQQINFHAIEELAEGDLPRISTQRDRKEAAENAVRGFSVNHNPQDLDPEKNENNPAGNEGAESRPGNTIPGPGRDLSIMIDGKLVNIKDQIQLYTTNQLISHPLVSPVLQPTLGGLPPLLILTGGGEILRDEQIYLAHKAADPSSYPPGEPYLKEYPQASDIIAKWKPTYVQLQVWDDLCHVAPTLSFTRPAKHMYRSIAQFGAWALARAQKTDIIMDDDAISVISTDTDSGSDVPRSPRKSRQEGDAMDCGGVKGGTTSTQKIGRAGDDLPPFHNHMIRQRVDRNGNIFPLGPPSSLPALQVHPNEIGVIKPGPVQKWMNAKQEWDKKYAKEKRRTQKRQAKEMAQGYQDFPTNDAPPPSALAGRRGLKMPKECKKHFSLGLRVWSLWGSSHDTKTVNRLEKVDRDPESNIETPAEDLNGKPVAETAVNRERSRSRSRNRTVADRGQAEPNSQDIAVEESRRGRAETKIDEETTQNGSSDKRYLSPADIPRLSPPTGATEPPDSSCDRDGDIVKLHQITPDA